MAKILIVDDDEAVLELIQRVLEKESHAVIEARNGETAFELLEWHEVDLVLLDYQMPEMDGGLIAMEFARRGIPFVFVTCETGQEFFEGVKELGALALLIKPFRLQQLKATVDEVLKMMNASQCHLAS